MNRFQKTKNQAEAIKVALENKSRSVLKYDFNLINKDTGLSTTVKQMPLKKIIELLKSYETPLKENIRDGVKVSGGHRSDRTTSSKVTKL